MDPFVQMGGTGETCPAASEEQIRAVIGKWADAAKRCQEAGFDGVELHFAHGFGAGGWFSPLWNHRTDQWGGSLENRARYGVEVVKAVRSAIGDWPVIAKINGEDGVEGGITLDDVVFFAGQLAETGIDALMVSGGVGSPDPKQSPSRLARAGKEGKNGEGYFAEATAQVLAAGAKARSPSSASAAGAPLPSWRNTSAAPVTRLPFHDPSSMTPASSTSG